MGFKLKQILIFLFAVTATLASGQDCDFDFDLGEDVVLTCGQTYVIQAPPGFDAYLWSTGSTAESIAVSQTGIYSCTISSSLASIITNGDFSAGDSDFDTDYIYGTGGPYGLLSNEGQYAVTSNPSLVHNNFANCYDHTTGLPSGSMLVANGANTSGTVVWEQSVNVNPNTDYVFSAWFMSVVADSPAQFSLVINGINVGSPFQISSTTCNWENFFANYNSGTNTTITLSIVNNNLSGAGNDFAIDDITFSPACTYTDSIEVTGASQPVLTLTPDTTICEGQSITLEASSDIPGSTFTWVPGFTNGSDLTITPAGDIQYTVVTTSPEGCNSLQHTVMVSVETPDSYTLNVPVNFSVCIGDPVDLTFPAAATGTYAWSPAEFLNDPSAANPTATITDTTTFTVVYTNICGDSQTATTDVNVLGGNLDMGDDLALCEGENYQIVLPSGPDYVWQDGSTGNIYTITETGLYTVSSTQGGCETTGSVFATVNPAPDIPELDDQTICAGETFTIDLTEYGYDYTWSDGSTNAVRNLTSSGVYAVEVTNGSCTVERSFLLNVVSMPIVDLGETVAICEGSQTILSVIAPNAQILWSTGESTSQIHVSQGGNYSVSVTLNGCAVTDEVLVTEGALPAINLTGQNTICSGETQVLSATANDDYSYEWNNGATTSSISITSGGNYSVKATDISTGCSSIREIDVTSLPAVRLVLPDTITLCAGKSRTLIAQVNSGDSVVWDDGTVGRHFTVSDPGLYTASVYGECGTAQKTVEVFLEDCSSTLYIPSAFTPDGDGINDIFKSYGFNVETFKIWIFDRWGNVVFQADNIDQGWNGSDLSGSYFVPSGEYPYKVEVQYDKSMDAEIVRGSVTVVR